MKRIQCVQRIPTTNYAYVELEMEYDSAEEAFIDHQRLLKLHESGAGIPARQWAQIRNKMLVTGECDPNLMEEMNHAQRWFVNELKLALRACKAEEPVIN